MTPRVNWLESELRNWSRYQHSGKSPAPLPQTRAASAEGRYVAELGELYEEPADRPVPVNVDRAKVVDDVYDNQLTPTERRVLRGEYVSWRDYAVPDRNGTPRFRRSKAARLQGLPLRVYNDMLSRAKRLVERALSK